MESPAIPLVSVQTVSSFCPAAAVARAKANDAAAPCGPLRNSTTSRSCTPISSNTLPFAPSDTRSRFWLRSSVTRTRLAPATPG